jgi:hypothetical protein
MYHIVSRELIGLVAAGCIYCNWLFKRCILYDWKMLWDFWRVTVDTTFNCLNKLYHLYLYCRCGITWGNCDMCYLECSYLGIIIVIVPYGGEGHVAATELHHLGGCMSTQKIVRQEEFFTHCILLWDHLLKYYVLVKVLHEYLTGHPSSTPPSVPY